MIECYQCGCEDELAVQVIWEDLKPRLVCLACQGMMEIPEEDHDKYRVLIEAAKESAKREQIAFIIKHTEELSEDMLPF